MFSDRVSTYTGNAVGTIAERYEKFKTYRTVVVNRGREAAELTVPDLLPRAGSTDQTDTVIPNQSLGNQGVDTLSGRLTTALMPPGTSGILVLEPKDPNVPASARSAFVSAENIIHQELNASGIRAGFHTGIQHLIVTGNACAFIAKDRTLRLYRVDQYVVNRQPDGTILEVITHDKVDIQSLPESIVKNLENWKDRIKSKEPDERLVDIFTHCVRKDLYQNLYDVPAKVLGGEDKSKINWLVVQEAEGVRIQKEPKGYRYLPFIPGRWSSNAGEHWGRSHVYGMRGDLKTFDSLAKAIREASAASSRVVFLANPAGMTDPDEVNNAENGDTVPGRQEDVLPLVADLRANLEAPLRYAMELQSRLSQQFLMVQGYKRDAERVTAFEKQMDAAELEDALGGAYSYLSKEFLEPIVLSFVEKLVNDGVLPEETIDVSEVHLLTGYAALGRQQNLQRMRLFIQDLSLFGPEALASLQMDEFINRLLKEHGIDPKNLVKSEEQRQQEQVENTAFNSLAEKAPEALTQGINI